MHLWYIANLVLVTKWGHQKKCAAVDRKKHPHVWTHSFPWSGRSTCPLDNSSAVNSSDSHIIRTTWPVDELSEDDLTGSHPTLFPDWWSYWMIYLCLYLKYWKVTDLLMHSTNLEAIFDWYFLILGHIITSSNAWILLQWNVTNLIEY